MKQTWRVLMRIVAFQCFVGIFGALIAFALINVEAAYGFLAGVSLIVISTLVAATLGLRHANLPLDSLVKVLGATFSKWLLVFAGVYFALTHWQLAALPLILGVIAAQLSVIIVGLRQPKY